MSTYAPIAGINVVDFTQNLPGPYATFMLASMGADVIKVETPKGDPARHMGNLFQMLNRGKKSITIDLQDEASKEKLSQIFGWADVVVEGFRPGVMDRLGAGFDIAKQYNPKIIYCSISAYGQDGPRRLEPGHDLNLQGVAGICHLEREPDGTPRAPVVPMADLSSSFAAATAICAALADRHREAVHLDVAMLDCVVSWRNLWHHGVDMVSEAEEQITKGPAGGLMGRLARPFLERLDRLKLYAIPEYGLYECGDGEWLVLGIVGEKHFWHSLCDELGLDRYRKIPMSGRAAMGPLISRAIGRKLKSASRDTWLERLRAAGVPASPSLRNDEAIRTEPQIAHRELIGPDGWMRAPLPGCSPMSGRAPELGEHNDEFYV